MEDVVKNVHLEHFVRVENVGVRILERNTVKANV